MNNEELALSIQAGDMAQCGPLWEQVKGIVIARARGYAAAYGDLCAACGVTAEDLEQSGFLAMLDAAEDYDPGRGCKFNTLLSWKLKLQFRAALDGGRRRRARDPLNDCHSLDAPAPGREEGGETVGDLLPDPVPACEDAEERVFQEQLGAAVRGCLDDLKDQRRAGILRREYLEGQTLREIAAQEGKSVSRIQQLRNAALRELQRPPYLPRLRPFAQEHLGALAWRGTGLSSFRSTGLSSVEMALERAEEDACRRIFETISHE